MLYRGSDFGANQSSTEALVDKARAGDKQAFGDLMVRHYHLLRRTAFLFLKRTEDVEDVVQDVSLNVLRKLHTFEGTAAFSTWLTRIAINASLQRLRHAHRRPISSLEELTDGDEAAFLPLADPAPNPEEQCSSIEMSRRLGQAISRLPTSLKEIAVDYLCEELPLIEVAGKRGLSLPATKSRAYRARRRLMTALSQPRRSIKRVHPLLDALEK